MVYVGHYLPAWLAGLLVPSGLATVRGLGALVAHIIPQDETSIVSERSLLGRSGVVSAGAARRGLAAQARVRDAHGRTHYLMVEPDIDCDIFERRTNPRGTQDRRHIPLHRQPASFAAVSRQAPFPKAFTTLPGGVRKI